MITSMKHPDVQPLRSLLMITHKNKQKWLKGLSGNENRRGRAGWMDLTEFVFKQD
jgi:hypothetical protein